MTNDTHYLTKEGYAELEAKLNYLRTERRQEIAERLHQALEEAGELFENAADIVCWLKTPAELGGKERYRNMILFHNRFLPLLQECPKNELKEIADTLKATKELMLKVNSLRQQAGLSAIEN